MILLSEIITYSVLFLALYIEVFFLITYFEIRAKQFLSQTLQIKISDKSLPTVSVIVPVWNEGTTVLKTVFSILKLDYPKDKLKVFIVDDGSTDDTWKVVQRFKNNKQVQLFQKDNGGKHTALNYALQFVESDLVGCLDADSYVHPQALKRIVAKFENKETMAVAPSVKVFEVRGILGLVQKAEYMFGIFLRLVLSELNAIYITPGPFSIFRTTVFKQIGNYRKAHNTEDMEIAMRMQKSGMKIDHAHDAFVYTVIPTTIYKLYKQRLRWVYGFLKNAIDYRDMFFKPQYGNLGMIVLPAAGFSVISTMFFFGTNLWSWIKQAGTFIERVMTVGFSLNTDWNFDLFYFNTDVIVFVSIIAVSGTLFFIATSRQLAEEKHKFGLDSLAFMLLYTILAPIWMSRAIYNVVFARDTKWR